MNESYSSRKRSEGSADGGPWMRSRTSRVRAMDRNRSARGFVRRRESSSLPQCKAQKALRSPPPMTVQLWGS